jgi:hypothetical protein
VGPDRNAVATDDPGHESEDLVWQLQTASSSQPLLSGCPKEQEVSAERDDVTMLALLIVRITEGLTTH